MTPTWRRIAVSSGLCAAAAAWIAVQPQRDPSVSPPAPWPATSPHHDLSCKPTSPFAVSIAPAGGAAWNVVVSSRETVEGVRVSGGSDTSAPREIWRGNLSAGESRRFQVRLGTGREVWVSAGLEADAAVQRSVAVATTGIQASQAPAGRLVTDPVTGESVFEYTGQTGIEP